MRPVASALIWCTLYLATGCGHADDKGAGAAPAPVASPQASGVIVIAPESPQLKQIRVSPVEVAAVPSDEVVAPGRVVTNPNRISRVLPQVGGRIVNVMVKFGDQVEQGQPLFTMDSADADAAVSASLQAESTERQTNAAVQKVEADFQRVSDLYEHKAVAQKDVLQAGNDLAAARSSYEIARAVQEQARRKLQVLELKPNEFHQALLVRAPINGRVLEVNVAPGEYRAATSSPTDTTAPLMSIADLSTVWVASDVPEPLVGLVRIGQPVTIMLVAFPDEVLTGKVTRIADALDPQTRTLKVYAELPNPHGRFRPEMFGTVRHSGAVKRMPVLPAAAIVQEYGRNTVFLERAPGQYERRQVTVGPPVGDRVPVLSGVQSGDRVVVDGAMLLKDR